MMIIMKVTSNNDDDNDKSRLACKAHVVIIKKRFKIKKLITKVVFLFYDKLCLAYRLTMI